MLEILAAVLGIALFFITLATVIYVTKTVCRPMIGVAKWMVGGTADPENETVSQIGFGVKILCWAGVVGVVVWLIFG